MIASTNQTMVSMVRSEDDVLHGKDDRNNFKEIKCKANMVGSDGMSWINEIPICPTFYPTMEEFEDPLSYLEKNCSRGIKIWDLQDCLSNFYISACWGGSNEGEVWIQVYY